MSLNRSLGLWDWVSGAYARPGVEALCLELQDQHGQCVSYLLWAAWAAREGRDLDEAALNQAVSLAQDWDAKAIRPLRLARRALKTPRPGIDAEGQATLRERIKRQELAAERLLMDALETRPPASAGPPRDMAAALGEAARAWGPAPHALIEALADAFSAA